MDLAPHEKRVLASVESSLRSTDPALATMLTKFTVPRWRKILCQGLSWRLTTVFLTAVFFAFAAAGLMLLTLLSAPAHQQQCSSSQGQHGLPGLTFAGCAPAHPSGK